MEKCQVKGCKKEAIGEETAPTLWDGYQTFKVWVDQHSIIGDTGDSWAGEVCVELPDGKYLAWDYWM